MTRLILAGTVLLASAVVAAVSGRDEKDASGGGGVAGAAASSCQRPYSRQSPWNAPIGRRPRYDPRSAYHVSALEGELTSDPTQYTYPVYEVTRRVARSPVRFSGVFSNVVRDRHLHILTDDPIVRMPIPADAGAARGSDAQIIVIDRDTGDEWVAWRLRRSGDGWEATNGARYNVRWDGVPPRSRSGNPYTARGAGIPYLAGLVRKCEIRRGRIDHALAFAYDYPRPEYVYPASKSDGKSTDPRDLPEGARLQLDPLMTARELRGRGCRGPCLTIARALQRYGMYVVDASGRPKVMMEYEATARWNGLVTADTVRPIPLSRFKLLRPPRPGRAR